jgi:hypothetical protein
MLKKRRLAGSIATTYRYDLLLPNFETEVVNSQAAIGIDVAHAVHVYELMRLQPDMTNGWLSALAAKYFHYLSPKLI